MTVARTARIKSLIPHRFPMLLIDRVVDVEPGLSLVAEKAVTCNEPWYEHVADSAGEGDYAYPTALLLESWCQAAALLAAWNQPKEALASSVALFGALSGVQVLRPALPGDLVRHQIRIRRALEGTWIFDGESSVSDTPILVVGSVMTALRPSSVLRSDLAASP